MAGFFGGFHQKKRLVLVQLKTTLGQVGRFFFWGVTHTHTIETPVGPGQMTNIYDTFGS